MVFLSILQHLSMARDIDIVMVNVVSGLGNGRIVPRGPLREPLQGFKRAQVVVLHHADLVCFPPTKVTGVNKYFDHF
jgi:tetraacyldisaccharide 4'-kinase